MLEFQSLRLKGFRSFVAEQELSFGKAGLTYLTGKNEVEPDLGANGVGKSSLFEALYWAFFGKTSRNLRAVEVVNWQQKSCWVAVDFVNHRQQHLRRTWNPNKLELNGKVVTQQELEHATGLTEDAFLYAIYHAQFVPHFADRAPSVQLDVFSEALRLQVWETASELAAQRAREHKQTVLEAEGEEKKFKERVKNARAAADAEEEKEVDWWREHLVGLVRSAQQLDQLSTKVEKLEEERSAIKVASTEEEHEAVIRAVADLTEVRNDLRAILKTKWPKAGKCPTCFQPVDTKLISRLKAKDALEVKELKKDCKWLEDEVIAAQNKLRTVVVKQTDSRNKVANLSGQLEQITEQYKKLQKELRSAADKECPYDSEARRKEEVEAVKQLLGLQIELDQSRQFIVDCEFWAKAFKDIRLALIDQALTQFELTTNAALSALGLAEWAVEYGVEAETKGGKVSRGFKIFVRSPFNKNLVPFVAWSGGESQRLRLAIAIGLSDLIQDFLGLHSNLEIFDEPTAWLSEEGINDVLTLLSRRAKERDAVIMLADHRAFDSSAMRRIIRVTKDEHGSVLE